MSHQPLIDGFEFASAGARQQGSWLLSEFPRLRDMLASDAGKVDYAVEGTHDAYGRPSLRVTLNGTLQLRCQRCLEPVRFDIRTDETLLLAATQAEIDADPADAQAPDRVLAGKEMALRELIEDELILAIPYAARHEACAARTPSEAQGKASPFADLRSLLQGKQKH